MDILGISCYYHDAAAVLLRDGHLIAAAEEERFSRIKHDYGFPKQAIKFCLEQGGITGAGSGLRRLFREALSQARPYSHDHAADLSEVVEGFSRVDDYVDAGQAVGRLHVAGRAGCAEE